MTKKVQKGRWYPINDKKTQGHKSLITRINRKKGTIKHIPVTHSPKTRRMKNIELQENPQKDNRGLPVRNLDNKKSHVLPKQQTSKIKYVGKQARDFKVTNKTDKSILRHIKKHT